MDLGIAGRVAVVSASSKGLGFASAAALAAEGCKVVMNGRDPDRLAAAAARIDGEVITVPGDMSDPATPAALVDAAVERWGARHIVVANNGGPKAGRAVDVTDEDVYGAVEANLVASLRLIRAARPHMQGAGWGRIACITSSSIKEPIPILSLSNVARVGLYAWAKTAANELGDGITINLVCPGLHDTDRIRALGRTAADGPIGDPADFGAVVAFLCSEQATFVNGSTVVVDGGEMRSLL